MASITILITRCSRMVSASAQRGEPLQHLLQGAEFKFLHGLKGEQPFHGHERQPQFVDYYLLFQFLGFLFYKFHLVV